MRKLATGLAWVAALAATACNNPLDVTNKNNPDVLRAFSSPAVVNQLIGTAYEQINVGLHGSSTIMSPLMSVFSFESYGTVANFGMAAYEGMPRNPINNGRNNQTFAENLRVFQRMSQRSRDFADLVRAVDTLVAHGQHLTAPTGNASDAVNLPAIDKRSRAFALFANGVALGNLALAYDSAAIVTPQVPSSEVPSLSGYADVMKAALALLDSAQAQAADPAAAAGFPLPTAYLNGLTLSQADFIRYIRSYKARFRAQVARTPTERAAVDWTQVLADAQNGITSNIVLQLGSAAGWYAVWEGQQIYQDNSNGWHQMSLMIFGMADTSGAYDTWIKSGNGAPPTASPYFLVKTADKRWPSGDTRAQQQANSPANSAWDYTKYPYIRNRSGTDVPGDPWGISFYDFYRWKAISFNNGTGPWVDMAKVEIDMLAAEASIRKGDFATAAALINNSREAAGLPPVLPQADGGLTGASCVPRVPVNANSTKCGDLMEAMKYEKRMETAFTGFGPWYFDSRGWGDLPTGTPIQWPVPYQEMDSRKEPFYNMGGAGTPGGAAKSTYGY